MSLEKLGVECVLMCLTHTQVQFGEANDVQLNM